MAYETYAFLLAGLSSLVLAVGIYYTAVVERRTSKASVLWSLMLFAFCSLWLYQFAEVLKYGTELYLAPEGSSPSWIVRGFESATGMGLAVFAEDIAHTMPGISAAIFLCVVLVVRRSVIMPL